MIGPSKDAELTDLVGPPSSCMIPGYTMVWLSCVPISVLCGLRWWCLSAKEEAAKNAELIRKQACSPLRAGPMLQAFPLS